jgi:Zn ribbon nucleic-acid-binding protein
MADFPMEPKDFVAAHYDVYLAKHGNATILVGHDPAMNWSVLKDGVCMEIDLVDTPQEARDAAHRKFDGDDCCSMKLIWTPILETMIAGCGCPGCGRHDLEDDDNLMSCPHCGWDHQYTDEEKAIKKHLKSNQRIG